MAIHEDLKLAFVVFELESYVGVYGIDENTGALAELYQVGLMPEPSAREVFINHVDSKRFKIVQNYFWSKMVKKLSNLGQKKAKF